jgi:hypothetical protein
MEQRRKLERQSRIKQLMEQAKRELEASDVPDKTKQTQERATQRAKERKDIESWQERKRDELAERDRVAVRAQREKEAKQKQHLLSLTRQLDGDSVFLLKLRTSLKKMDEVIGPVAHAKYGHKIREIIDTIVAESPQLAQLEADRKETQQSLAEVQEVLSSYKWGAQDSTRKFGDARRQGVQEKKETDSSPNYYAKVLQLIEQETPLQPSARLDESSPPRDQARSKSPEAGVEEVRTPLTETERSNAHAGVPFMRRVEKFADEQDYFKERRKEIKRKLSRLEMAIIRTRGSVGQTAKKLLHDIVKIDQLQHLKESISLAASPHTPTLPPLQLPASDKKGKLKISSTQHSHKKR